MTFILSSKDNKIAEEIDLDNFNKYFLGNYIVGLWKVDNIGEHRFKIFEILKRHNLL